MTTWMLDTDTCVYLVNRRAGFERVLRRMEGRRYGEIRVSAVTLAELRYGIARSARRTSNAEKVEAFLQRFDIVAFDERAAAEYGTVRAGLERAGRVIGPLDTLIAAHALSLGCILVTNNVREFGRVPRLRVENWAAA
jgi:tRNA(fMet)-specific endonuclease VapC